MLEILDKFRAEKDILLGVCSASKMDWLIPMLQETQTPFVSRDIERRINPHAIMPSAKSIIVIGLGGRAAPPKPADSAARGRLAGIAANKDYHRIVRALLEELVARLSNEQIFEYKIFTDTGYLNERALAVQAGLGFIGKNGSIISNKFGSFFNIGYMLIDTLLSQNKSVAHSTCGDCQRCISACPGRALENGLDARKCISYITQKKDMPTAEESYIMGNWLYGCDICQDVCPFNSSVERCSVEAAYPLLADCVDITNSEFEGRYSESSLYWRGVEIFKRNATIAVKNCIS